MATYKCLACGYIYDEDSEKENWDELPDDWTCPTCGAEKSFFDKLEEEVSIPSEESNSVAEADDKYLSEWRKQKDDYEPYLSDIHAMAEKAESISEPMKTRQPVISWDQILIKGAQLDTIPLNREDAVNMQTIIGPNAKHPLVIETPVYITHMSFGALSKEIKIAMAKGSAAVKTVMCSGEGGILPEEFESAYKYIFEYVPNEYSVNEENLKKADAIEIKVGQSVKPGMGGHLPAQKVTDEIAKVRGKASQMDIYSPASFKDIRSKEELKQKVDWLRKMSEGKPIGVKIAAGNIEADLAIILYAMPDFITIDGRGGATGSAPKFLKDSASVPTLFALYRARKYFDENNAKGISLVITGGLRISSDFAKAIALGADAIAIGTAAMIAGGCQQYKICNTGNCPVGIATQDPELRRRLSIAKSAQRIENYLKVSTEELRDFARLTGNKDVHGMCISDLCTCNHEISLYTSIEHV
ncbi:FMN-binding glutamate synthase family protein [Labilibacter sediminis]|nr:FMN-binding glutamate synthase family protein [Labilibacter sediminis]